VYFVPQPLSPVLCLCSLSPILCPPVSRFCSLFPDLCNLSVNCPSVPFLWLYSTVSFQCSSVSCPLFLRLQSSHPLSLSIMPVSMRVFLEIYVHTLDCKLSVLVCSASDEIVSAYAQPAHAIIFENYPKTPN
jgi:hypothetical protein